MRRWRRWRQPLAALQRRRGSGAPPPPPQTSGQYLYVAHNYTVDIYALPLTSFSTPAFSISNLNDAVGLAFDANGDLYVTQIGGNASSLPGNSVAIFAPPFSASSTPAVVITNGLSAPRAVAVDASGNLYVGNGNDVIDVFTPPFSASSALATSFSTVGSATLPAGMGFDAKGNLYVANNFANDIDVFTPPFTSNSTAAYVIGNLSGAQDVAFDANGNLYVSYGNAIGVFTLPFSTSSAPAYTIGNLNGPYGIGFDKNGNLYVVNNATNTIMMFSPPFSASSAPAVTLTVSGSTPERLAIR